MPTRHRRLNTNAVRPADHLPIDASLGSRGGRLTFARLRRDKDSRARLPAESTTTAANASGSRQPPPEAARSRQPDVMRGRRTFPALDGSSDCGGIRDCERAGHSGQEGETRGRSAWLSLGCQAGPACSREPSSGFCRPGLAPLPGSARRRVLRGAGPAPPGGSPRLGLRRAKGPAAAAA